VYDTSAYALESSGS